VRLNHSYSAFKQFDNCPLRYYRQRVLKDIKDEMGEAGLEGDRQHKALENRVAFGTPLPKDCAMSWPPRHAARTSIPRRNWSSTGT